MLILLDTVFFDDTFALCMFSGHLYIYHLSTQQFAVASDFAVVLLICLCTGYYQTCHQQPREPRSEGNL